jgi:hypothetical protein
MTPEEIGQFATESEARRSVYISSYIDERDGKNWDANVQVAHREAVIGLYRTVSPELADQASKQLRVKGTYRKDGIRVTYEVNGTVKSGHWDTSSGNAALNIEITAQALASLPGAVRPVEARGLVMGDDLLLWVYFDHRVEAHEYASAMTAAERGLGINPVRGIFSEVLNVSFCSMGFYWTNDGQLVALPKIGRCFAKLFWTVTALAGRCPARLASTIAHAFLPAFGTYRPMREFLKYHARAPPLECECTDALPYVLREHQLPRTRGVRWHECNVVKYGIPPDALEDMGEMLASVGCGVVSHAVVSEMIRQDCSDPPERRGVLA